MKGLTWESLLVCRQVAPPFGPHYFFDGESSNCLCCTNISSKWVNFCARLKFLLIGYVMRAFLYMRVSSLVHIWQLHRNLCTVGSLKSLVHICPLYMNPCTSSAESTSFRIIIMVNFSTKPSTTLMEKKPLRKLTHTFYKKFYAFKVFFNFGIWDDLSVFWKIELRLENSQFEITWDKFRRSFTFGWKQYVFIFKREIFLHDYKRCLSYTYVWHWNSKRPLQGDLSIPNDLSRYST